MSKVTRYIKMLREMETAKLEELVAYAKKQNPQAMPATLVLIESVESELAMRALYNDEAARVS